MTQEEYITLKRLDKIMAIYDSLEYTVKRLDKTSGLIICYDHDDLDKEKYFFYHRCRLTRKYVKTKPGGQASRTKTKEANHGK